MFVTYSVGARSNRTARGHPRRLVTGGCGCADQANWLHVERLPAYAPELNPVEYLWSYWKQHELANSCPKDIWELGHAASQALKRIRRRKRRPKLIAAFFAQAELF